MRTCRIGGQTLTDIPMLHNACSIIPKVVRRCHERCTSRQGDLRMHGADAPVKQDMNQVKGSSSNERGQSLNTGLPPISDERVVLNDIISDVEFVGVGNILLVEKFLDEGIEEGSLGERTCWLGGAVCGA